MRSMRANRQWSSRCHKVSHLSTILLTFTDKAVTRSEKNTNAMTHVPHAFHPHIDFGLQVFPHHQHHGFLTWHIITYRQHFPSPFDLRHPLNCWVTSQALSLCYC